MKIYLACPYSHPLLSVRRRRIEAASKHTAALMQKGHIVFSPLPHSHGIADYIKNHLDHDFWLKQCLPFVEWCDQVRVLKMDGWNESKGIKREVEYAKQLGKPVYFI